MAKKQTMPAPEFQVERVRIADRGNYLVWTVAVTVLGRDVVLPTFFVTKRVMEDGALYDNLVVKRINRFVACVANSLAA